MKWGTGPTLPPSLSVVKNVYVVDEIEKWTIMCIYLGIKNILILIEQWCSQGGGTVARRRLSHLVLAPGANLGFRQRAV